MQIKHCFLLLSVFLGGLALGCAVDNEFMAKLPGFEARSDKIPGLLPARERIEILRNKGEVGRKAPPEEQAVLLAQLMHEYETAPAMNLKREAVDAMGKIQHADQYACLKEVLHDSDSMIRISALQAIGHDDRNPYNPDLITILIEHSKRDPDKDVRVVAMNRLGGIGKMMRMDKKGSNEELSDRIFDALADGLHDKLTIIRFEAMQMLAQTTGLDYGNDINRWLQYVQYKKGESRELPKERTLTERLPTIHLPMFK